jgi:hypothetical protein
MNALTQPLFQRIKLNGIIIDLFALAFIYLVPTLSHLLSVPVYLIEPMRLMLILALVHTNKTNGYILALSLPLFSFFISGHPVFPKMILIMLELSLNVFLFFLLAKKSKHIFIAAITSIVLSKSVYYLLKFILVQLTLIKSELVSTPFIFQAVMALIFSFYLSIFFKLKTNPDK